MATEYKPIVQRVSKLITAFDYTELELQELLTIVYNQGRIDQKIETRTLKK